MPKASFIGFTGTPIEKTDSNTRAVFGDYISIYHIQRAVADKATVPIYYPKFGDRNGHEGAQGAQKDCDARARRLPEYSPNG